MAIFILAFSFTFKAGERGFFTLDQSIVFDGSYRILSGQVPYRDFIAPIGPVVFWLQAIFFKTLGINYYSYIFGSAFINLLATVLSVIILRFLFPRQKYLSYIAGFLTAIWFYPPSGTPWAEQTAFFLSLLAIAAILLVRFLKNGRSFVKIFFLLLSGIFASLSILSKQNAGLPILPLYFILLIVTYLPNLKLIFYSCIMFLIGAGGSLSLFLWWIWVKSNPENFLDYFFQIPALQGVCRILDESKDFWRIFFTGACSSCHLHQLTLGIRLILSVALLIAAFAFILSIFNIKRTREVRRDIIFISLFCIYAVFFQYMFIHTTMNQAENGIPFIGIIFACSLGLSLNIFKTRLFNYRLTKLIFSLGISSLIFYIALVGTKVSLSRKVQEFSNSEFTENFPLDKLKALKWGKPTKIWGFEIKQEDVVNLLNYLKEKNKNFFVFPNFTILYGLLNVPSPQPILWFHSGLTYHVVYNPSLDKWIVNDLIKNKVGVIVIEENLFYSNLDDFPQLKQYVSNNFIEAKKIGIFHIWENKKQG
jgi:4-amino-4-deoxy-L-arabinose transferase-like glycosyltransferase